MSRGPASLPPPGRLAALGLALVVGATFAEAVAGRGVFFQRDIHAYWHPQIESFVRVVAEGAWPLWNPYVAFGAPLLADPNLQLAYPPTWLNLILPAPAYYTLFVVSHCWLAGMGLYLLARRWGLSAPAAFLAGASWCVSGPLVSAASLFHHLAGAAWIPWVLLGVEAVLRHPVPLSALALGAAAAVQVLAGSGEMVLASALCAALRAGALLAHRPLGDWVRPAALAAGAAAVAAALSAVQWLPAAVSLESSARLSQGGRASLFWSLHPLSLIELAVPRLLSELPLSAAARAALFESREPLLYSLYAGPPVLVLAALGAALPGSSGRIAAVVGALFFLACALGRHTPFFPLLVALPPFSLGRYPVKYMLPASLFWSLLGGLGLEAWRQGWTPVLRRRATGVLLGAALLSAAAAAAAWWVAQEPPQLAGLLSAPGASGPAAAGLLVPKLARLAGTGAAAALLLALRLRRSAPLPLLGGGMLALALGDLVLAARPVNPLAPAELFRHRPPVLDVLDARAGHSRLYASALPLARMNEEFARVPAGWDPRWAWALGHLDLLQAPLAARWRLEGSYDGNFTGLAPAALSTLSLLVERHLTTPLGPHLLRLGNVGHVVTLERIPSGLQEVAQFPSVFSSPVRVYRVPQPLPRGYWVPRARATSEAAALTLLADPSFPFREEVLVTGGEVPAAAAAGKTGTVRVAARRSDRMTIEVESDGPGWLVLVEAYDPGWKAWVDGRQASVQPGNLLFRAVPLPGGRHRVELRYRPGGVLWGAALTGAALLGGLAFWGRAARRGAGCPRQSGSIASGA